MFHSSLPRLISTKPWRRKSVAQSAGRLPHAGSDERFNRHFRRIHLIGFGYGHIMHSVVFSIDEAITTFDRWVASNLKRFHDAFPQGASPKYFYDWCRRNVSREAPDVLLYSALNTEDMLCHAPTSARDHELSRGLHDSSGPWRAPIESFAYGKRCIANESEFRGDSGGKQETL